MPTRLHLVNEYLNSKGYKKKDWYTVDFSKFEPYLIPHRTLKKHLFCTLTSTTVPMNPAKVEVHMGSNRFKEAKAAREEKESKQVAAKEKRKELVQRLRKKKESKETTSAEKTASDAGGKAGRTIAKKSKLRGVAKKLKAENDKSE